MILDAIIRFADSIVVRISPIVDTITAALVIIFLGFIAGKLLSSLTYKILQDANADKHSKKVLKKQAPLARILSTSVKVTLYGAAILWALATLDLAYFAIATLFLCFFAVLAFSALFTIRDLIPNLLARREHPLKPGESIKSPVQGRIERQGPINTIIKRKNGDIFAIPNKLLRRKKA